MICLDKNNVKGSGSSEDKLLGISNRLEEEEEEEEKFQPWYN